ncbi:MAG: hypothetical protein JW781_01645 [Deltaproteobacteria bacterium]|nr:hypothetical protein [Candidatus Anaeroferrophillacea bacterium]
MDNHDGIKETGEPRHEKRQSGKTVATADTRQNGMAPKPIQVNGTQNLKNEAYMEVRRNDSGAA